MSKDNIQKQVHQDEKWPWSVKGIAIALVILSILWLFLNWQNSSEYRYLQCTLVQYLFSSAYGKLPFSNIIVRILALVLYLVPFALVVLIAFSKRKKANLSIIPIVLFTGLFVPLVQDEVYTSLFSRLALAIARGEYYIVWKNWRWFFGFLSVRGASFIGFSTLAVFVVIIIAMITRNRICFLIAFICAIVQELTILACVLSGAAGKGGYSFFVVEWLIVALFIAVHILIIEHMTSEKALSGAQRGTACLLVKFCPSCGKQFAAEKKYCDCCGKDLLEIAGYNNPKKMYPLFCPKCGVGFEIGKKFCDQCGGELTAKKKTETN